jgi:isopentenyl diphosphate isomerase/L-lactate dehydrogenase-like FMN-dependent dehydrogenase
VELTMMGAERELALVNNFEAFARLRLMTKFLVGLGERDASIELFRKRIAFPLAVAPTDVTNASTRWRWKRMATSASRHCAAAASR